MRYEVDDLLEWLQLAQRAANILERILAAISLEITLGNQSEDEQQKKQEDGE